MPSLRLTLLRHGETTGQSSVRYYGTTDVPLSDLGREQMRRAAQVLIGQRFTGVFSSMLSRSREGAEIACAGRFPVTPLAALNDVNFGEWEGLTREEIALRDPENYCRWQESKGLFHYPGGESRAEFHARVIAGVREVLDRHRRGHVLLVVHRGVIASILAELLGLDHQRRAALHIDLGSLHTVAANRTGWHAEVLNRIDHLG